MTLQWVVSIVISPRLLIISPRRNKHDDVIKWKHFPRYWPFVWGIHRSPVNFPHKGQWHEALTFSLICALNKRLSKQPRGRWFEMPSPSLWRHFNEWYLYAPLACCWFSHCFVTCSVLKQCVATLALYFFLLFLYLFAVFVLCWNW